MTSRDLVASVEEGDSLAFGSISERCVYLYLRYHADKKGVFRLAMTELAAMLNVNRQTVLKHIDALMQRRLVARIGHGRYLVMAAPRSMFDAAKAYRATLKPGDEWSSWDLAEKAFGVTFTADSNDPGLDEAMEYTETLHRAGRLRLDERTGVYTVAPDA